MGWFDNARNGVQSFGQKAKPVMQQMGQGIKSWANSEFDQNNFNNPSDIMTSGNKFKDFGIGALAGLQIANRNQYDVRPVFNYAGNGLARIGHIREDNPYYSDGSDLAEQLRGALAKRKRAAGFQPYNTNLTGHYNDIEARYTLPTENNKYAQPGLYQDGQRFNPFGLPQSDLQREVLNAVQQWQNRVNNPVGDFNGSYLYDPFGNRRITG